MSQKTSGPLSKFNLALALLWLVDVVVTVAGYLVLTSSNATQAEFYTSQSSDYVAYFTAQSGSNLGATLLGAGVIGFIITLAAHAVSWSIAKNAIVSAPVTTTDEPDFDFDDDTDFDTDETASVKARAAETGTVTASAGTAGADVSPAASVPANEAPATAAPTETGTGDEPTDEPKTAR